VFQSIIVFVVTSCTFSCVQPQLFSEILNGSLLFEL
jgi:hypothetical protein